MRKLLLPILILASTSCFGQTKAHKTWLAPGEDLAEVSIHIKPTYNGRPLQPGSQYYVNAYGDTFYIDEFRIYITDLIFDNRNELPPDNHLFDATDTDTYKYSIYIFPGVYQSLQFIAGVDSIANTSGANGGDLDPVKGMYWAWNSGYIMAKLEGHSSACKTLHHAFEFHIGGYMPPYNTARKVTLPIPGHFKVSRDKKSEITLNADVAAWINNIDLSKVNSILIPGKDAAMMADKYARMFSIDKISYTP